jgi:transglutaminase-like putative cysteine protease
VRYDIRHVTAYTYGAPVPQARCVMHLLPTARASQTVFRSAVTIRPEPTWRRERTDAFGNDVIDVGFETSHDRLQIIATSSVEIKSPDLPHPASTPTWEAVRAATLETMDLGRDSPVHGLFPSRHVPLVGSITSEAAAMFVANRPILEAALALTKKIKASYLYDPKATEISTPIVEAHRLRRGVCQDFAHIMIAGLRGLGLSAMYVSGYLRTIPAKGKERLEGADASHAWVSLWCGPQIGWVGLDPTNGIPAGTDHVVIAIGRDYADVAPVSGVILSSGKHDMSVAVDVLPIE